MTTPRARGALHLPLNTLALRRGGLIRAVILRANALVEAEPDRPVVIEVLAFQSRLAEDVADLVERGFLDPRVHVRSVLRSIAPDTPPATCADPIVGCVHLTGAPPEPAPVPADPRAVVLAEPALPPRVRRRTGRDELGRLRTVEILDGDGRVRRREEYGTGDRLLRVQEFRADESLPVVHRWVQADGSCYLAVWQEPGSSFWGAAFGLLAGTLVPMSSPQEMYRLVFEQLLRTEIDPVLFSEFRDQLPNLPGRGFDPVVPAVRHPTLRRVAVVHSNHAVQGEHELPMRSSPNFTALLRSLARWDLLVVATERQRDDIAEQYGHPDRVRAIAHFAPPPAGAIDAPIEANRFVLVARIHRKKRVDEALHVFRLLLDENPQARLELYGFGYGDALEARIRALVGELGLTGSVEFRGFVDDPADIYAGACATLQTSESEGFGMALLESLSAGVPVVAYDVRYGAREVLRDDVDGYVVPWGDRTAMAARLLEIARDPELRARLGAAGPDGVRRFSRERYQREWQDALAALPVHVDRTAPARARITGGRLVLAFPPELGGTAALRRRDRRGEATAQVAAGTASIPLPTAGTGDILDVFLAVDGVDRRVGLAGGGTSDEPTWRLYTTDHGYLSLRRVVPEAAAARAGGAARTASFGRRALRRLRRLQARR